MGQLGGRQSGGGRGSDDPPLWPRDRHAVNLLGFHVV
jgi:hypothetical protein